MKDNEEGEEMAYAYAWYQAEQWQLLRSVSIDRDQLEETFEEWHSMAKDAFRQYRKDGLDIHKVVIDVQKLIDWCKEQNQPVEGGMRAAFAAHKLREEQDRRTTA